MDEDDGEFEGHDPPAARFTHWDVLIAAFGMLMGVFHAISTFFETLLKASVMAANRQMERDTFAESAGMEIERITTGVEDNG